MTLGKICAALVAVVLAACGGGGGSGGGSSPTPPAPAAISFSPATLTSNYKAGTSSTVTLNVTVSNPADFANQTVHVFVVDPIKTLQGDVQLTSLSGSVLTATFHTSGQLAAGHYTGALTVQLCKDAQCAAQFPGSPVSLPYDLTVTESLAPLSATALMPTTLSTWFGSSSLTDIGISVGGDKLVWTASSADSWLRVNQGSGVGAGSFTVSVLSASLAVGDYQSQVTVSTQDGQTSTVPFKLTIMPTGFELTSGIPTFTAVNGAPITAQGLSFELDSEVAAPWTVTNDAAWLVVSPMSGTTPSVIGLRPDPSIGPLAHGNYSANLVLSSPGIKSKAFTSTLKLLQPTLATTSNAVTFGGTKGRDFTPQSFAFTLNTDSKAWAWTLSSLPAGVSASATQGQIAAAGSTITLTADPTQIAVGSSSSALTLSSQVNGDALSAQVTLNINLDQRKLLLSESAVALASTPTGSLLSRTVNVSDNFGGTLAWTAQSSAAWLSVSNSGSTSATSPLTLTADPAGLPSDVVSYATVTISTATPGITPTSLRVGLWKSASGAVALLRQPLNYRMAVADRIRPYVYVHAGGTFIDVYNAYTGQKVSTLSNVGTALGPMSTSPDGNTLYVLDTGNPAVVLVDLDSGAVRETWALPQSTAQAASILAIRPNGVEVLLIGDGSVYASGKLLSHTVLGGSLTATADGLHVFSQNSGTSPATIDSVDLDYSAMSGGVLLVSNHQSKFSLNNSSNGRDIAVSPDGQRLYTAAGAPYVCSIAKASDLSLIGSLPGGAAYPNNVEVTWNGKPVCGIAGGNSTGSDFWVYSSAGALISANRLAGNGKELKDRQVVVTPDGMIVVALATDPAMVFLAIGP